MIDSKKIWEKICNNIESYQMSAESTLQIIVENIFDMLLGWDKSLGCITRPQIKFGSSNSGIPDLILSKDRRNRICIELKKFMVGIKERNKEQLFSYMRQLKLSFGILWGNSIQLYFDEISDDEPPICVLEIPFEKENKLGVQLVEQLNYDIFNFDNFKEFCFKQIQLNRNKIDIENKINFLCSSDGVKYIKGLLQIEYPAEVVDNLQIVVNSLKNKNGISKLEYKANKVNYLDNVQLDSNLSKRKGEKTQDWIKRILLYLEQNNLLTEEEIERLQDKEYSKNTLGIQYPLFVDNNIDIIDSTGRCRYWTSWPNKHEKYMGKYYVCSQWWLGQEGQYEYLINKWVSRLINNSK